MKKIVSVLFIVAGLFLLLGNSWSLSASTSPKLFMDGKQLITDVDPVIKKGTTLVPLAVLSSGLGYEVKWDNVAKQVAVIDKDLTIKLSIGQNIGYVNDKTYELTHVPILEKNRTMVPLRFVSEVLGYKVDWNQKDAEVLITSPVKDLTPTPTPTPTPSPTPVPTPSEQTATVTAVEVSEEGNVRIAYTGELLAPKVMLLPKDENNPDRLVVDLYNTAYTYDLSSKFIGGMTNVSLNGYLKLSGYRFGQNSIDPLIARFVVLLNDGVRYRVSKTDTEVNIHLYGEGEEMPEEEAPPSDGGVTTPTPAPSPAPTPDGQGIYHIVLDAGHGDTDPGAVNKTLNLFEKNFNLSAVLKLKAELEKHKQIKIHLTRSDDTFLELSERVAFAENIPGLNKKADLFISVHANSYKTSTINGTETYYFREDSKELAHALHPKIVQAVGLNDRGVRTASFKVIRETTMPAVLLEVGYISNSTDAKALFDEQVQANFAKQTAAAIIEYLNLKK